MKKLFILFCCLLFMFTQEIYAASASEFLSAITAKGTIQDGDKRDSDYWWYKAADSRWYVIDGDQLSGDQMSQDKLSACAVIGENVTDGSAFYFMSTLDGHMETNTVHIRYDEIIKINSNGEFTDYDGNLIRENTDIEKMQNDKLDNEQKQLESQYESKEQESVSESTEPISLDKNKDVLDNSTKKLQWELQESGKYKLKDGDSYIINKLVEEDNKFYYVDINGIWDGQAYNNYDDFEKKHSKEVEIKVVQPSEIEIPNDNFTISKDDLFVTSILTNKTSMRLNGKEIPIKFTAKEGISNLCSLQIGAVTYDNLPYTKEVSGTGYINLPKSLVTALTRVGLNIIVDNNFTSEYNSNAWKFNAETIKTEDGADAAEIYTITAKDGKKYIIPVFWVQMNNISTTIDFSKIDGGFTYGNNVLNAEMCFEYKDDMFSDLTEIKIPEVYMSTKTNFTKQLIDNTSLILVDIKEKPHRAGITNGKNYTYYEINGINYINSSGLLREDLTPGSSTYEVSGLSDNEHDFKEANNNIKITIYQLFLVYLPVICIVFGTLLLTLSLMYDFALIRIICYNYFDIIKLFTFGRLEYNLSNRVRLIIMGVRIILFGAIILMLPQIIDLISQTLIIIGQRRGE